MKKRRKGVILCLSIALVFVMPISAVKNEVTIVDEASVTPNDSYFGEQWGLDNTGQTNPYSGGGAPGADIDAPEAWDIETGSPDVIIAVIDCGIDYAHPDLADNIWINEDEIPDNGVDDDNNGYVDDIRGWNFLDGNNEVLDIAGHGTACAGVVAAVTDNGVGIAGVCWNCKIMTVISDTGFDDCPHEAVADGIKYAADNGADVISMSIGVYRSSDLVNDAVNYAYNKGVILVAAAGNEGRSSKLYPAGYENVIAVGATDNTDSKMDIVRWGNIRGVSNYGDWVDVAAPGVDIYVTMPTYRVAFNDLLGVSQNYDYMSGTSFSCPHVAGIAALLLSQDPSLSNDEVRKIIRANVDPYDSNVYIGTGRVNAYKALTRYNTPPNKPEKPTGPTSGQPGTEYTYNTSTTDPLGDQIYYTWDWGDGNYSEWLGPYESGGSCEASYTWEEKGDYSIKVKAKDIYDLESDWSDPLPVSMPKTYENPLEPLLEKMFICHIVSTGTGNFKILTGAILHGFAGISAFSIDLENDGYTTISSLFNPDYRFTIIGNQQIIIIGYAGYFTWESKEDNAILSINGVALIATVTQTS